MDFKPFILCVSTFILTDIDNVLHTSVLCLNFAYLGYQFYTFHKKNKDKNDTE